MIGSENVSLSRVDSLVFSFKCWKANSNSSIHMFKVMIVSFPQFIKFKMSFLSLTIVYFPSSFFAEASPFV